MRAYLFTGGELPSRAMLESVDPFLSGPARPLVAAADSGYDSALSWGVEPDFVVGDMDSISAGGAKRSEARALRFDRDKDETDTEIGVRLLRERGCRDIRIIGGDGGRLDHLLAIAAMFSRPEAPTRWYARDQWAERVDGELERECAPGDTVSVFPASAGRCAFASEGLLWPLDGLLWPAGSFGISNRATGAGFRVVATSGRALVIAGYPVARRP